MVIETLRMESLRMRIKIRQILSWMIVFVMLLSMVQGISVNVRADDVYTPTYPYVLKFGPQAGASIHWYAQFSHLVPSLSYDGDSIDGYSIIFGLHNDYTGEDFQSLYCTDIPVDATEGSNYQRLNLEDSTYASAIANRLRGVLFATYPYITLDELIKNSGIEGLTKSEAITGSQITIWQLAHGDNVKVIDFLNFYASNPTRGDSEEQKELDAEGERYYNGTDEEKAASKQRIEKLYNYLLSQPLLPASKVVASGASFVDKSEEPIVMKNGNGTCDVTVQTTVSVEITGSDALTLTAHMENGLYYTTLPLSNGKNSYTLTIKNVPVEYAGSTVTLAIDGKQYAKDVFLVDGEGIRGATQSMIGVMDGELPVHAETDVSPDRVLTIMKTDGNKGALGNISFDVYYVGSVDDFVSGKLNIGKKPTTQDIKKYAVYSNLVGTLTTDSSGYASLNLGTEDGVYLVKELHNDAISETIEPFFVSLPDYSRCDENGNPAYTITAYPKNTVQEEKVDILKDVTEIGNEKDNFDVGEDHTWIIRTSIPKSLSSGKAYTITDTLDTRLTYQRIEKMVLANETEDVLTLTEEQDYTVIYEMLENTQERITISLTEVGMKKVGQEAGASYESCELRTYMIAQINQTATVGEAIPNQAHISFTNNIGRTYDADSDKPEVSTGGIQLKKMDKSQPEHVLSGATFTVYRDATQDELAQGTSYEVVTIGDTPHKLIKVSFYNTKDMAGEKGQSLTTDESGMGYIYGLSYGTYYLMETQAPAGYHMLPEPIRFEIGETSHLETSMITVENSAGTELPSTGGVGTGVFTGLGLCLVIGSVVILVSRKRMTAV